MLNASIKDLSVVLELIIDRSLPVVTIPRLQVLMKIWIQSTSLTAGSTNSSSISIINAGVSSRKGAHGKKPDNWAEDFDFHRENGSVDTLQRYRSTFPGLYTEAIRAKLKWWNSLQPLKANSIRAPSYG